MAVAPLTNNLPDILASAVDASLETWATDHSLQKFWNRDASLWTGTDEHQWLGWLDITGRQVQQVERFVSLAGEVQREKFSHALLLGMGGSSLCPEVMKMTFGKVEGFPELHVLDSTDPSQIRALEAHVDLARTLCIVSSKSGSTLEPNIFAQYFFERVKQVVGAGEAGRRFIAITDPGSQLEKVARRDGFRHIFEGDPSIGGRYSALSNFGMVPAAVMGVNVRRVLGRAQDMVQECGPSVPPKENPGVVLGTILGVAAGQGRDKVTIVASPGLWDLGAWLEQLVAESTGKVGKGLIPVDRERIGVPEVYGDDRLFVYVRLDASPDSAQDNAMEKLEQSGQPVIRIAVQDIHDVGREFFRWEMATAVAGAILGINAFNQPDVEASKIATKKITAEYEQTGALPAEKPFGDQDGIKLFSDDQNVSALTQGALGNQSLAAVLRAHMNRIGTGDYFGLLAYVNMNESNENQLQDIRHLVRDAKKVATCLGFGPRFLHSTGQAYKGGPNTGVFLQITCEEAADLQVPGQRYTFGTVKAAQARGDFQVLADRGRRALRVHLGTDVTAGLATLRMAMEKALEP